MKSEIGHCYGMVGACFRVLPAPRFIFLPGFFAATGVLPIWRLPFGHFGRRGPQGRHPAGFVLRIFLVVAAAPMSHPCLFRRGNLLPRNYYLFDGMRRRYLSAFSCSRGGNKYSVAMPRLFLPSGGPAGSLNVAPFCFILAVFCKNWF
ncbi:MAG: hypothetical protein CM15mP21_7510 [Hyphomicrobiales bacterium]|nr:MAG: hypothetical protein CM15mP21_7510 [Hyphomicrobiales bacterium]